MPVWGWWLLLAAVLAAGESLTLTLVLGLAAIGAATAAGVSALGAGGLVLDRVDRHGGRIRLRGEVWTARVCDGTDPADTVEAGGSVRVLAIDGATALVYPAEV